MILRYFARKSRFWSISARPGAPCRRVAPEVEAVAAQMTGKARVFTVDVDAEPDLAARYHVQGIPDLIIFKNGRVVDQFRGAHPRQVIIQKLQQYV